MYIIQRSPLCYVLVGIQELALYTARTMAAAAAARRLFTRDDSSRVRLDIIAAGAAASRRRSRECHCRSVAGVASRAPARSMTTTTTVRTTQTRSSLSIACYIRIQFCCRCSIVARRSAQADIYIHTRTLCTVALSVVLPPLHTVFYVRICARRGAVKSTPRNNNTHRHCVVLCIIHIRVLRTRTLT